MLERNGRQKTKAVCAVSRKLVRVIHAVIETGTPFDRDRWLADHPGEAAHQRARQTAKDRATDATVDAA